MLLVLHMWENSHSISPYTQSPFACPVRHSNAHSSDLASSTNNRRGIAPRAPFVCCCWLRMWSGSCGERWQWAKMHPAAWKHAPSRSTRRTGRKKTNDVNLSTHGSGWSRRPHSPPHRHGLCDISRWSEITTHEIRSFASNVFVCVWFVMVGECYIAKKFVGSVFFVRIIVLFSCECVCWLVFHTIAVRVRNAFCTIADSIKQIHTRSGTLKHNYHNGWSDVCVRARSSTRVVLILFEPY